MSKSITARATGFDARQQQWDRIRNALEGSDAIKNNGTIYLDQPSGMTITEYTAYKNRAAFYPVAERTLRGMTGMICRKPARIDLPKRLEGIRTTATSTGNPLGVMIEDALADVLSLGRKGWLLDFPANAPSSLTIPYFAVYDADCILDHRTEIIDGIGRLTYLTLSEDAGDEDGDEVVRHLAIENGQYVVRRWLIKGKSESLIEEITPTVNGKPLTEIPFVCISPYDLRVDLEKPPMLDLVDVNISHYRNSADYEHALYLTAQPTPYVTGQFSEADRPKAIGSGSIWVLPEGATAGMLEFSGAGIEAQRKAMEDKENRMAALGARMINEGRNRNEAADTAKMRGSSELSLVAGAVNYVEAGLERLLRIAATWVRANPDEVKVELNRDWVSTQMDPNTLNSLIKAWQSGAISHETLWSNLQRGEFADPAKSLADERDQIEADGGDMSQIIPLLQAQTA